MKYSNLNVFAAWYLALQTVGMAWVSGAGTLLLRAFALPAQEGDVPSRLVGGLLLLFVLFLGGYFRHGLPPQGNPAGSGYAVGHKLLLVGNVLAGGLFVFQFFAPGIDSHNLHLLLDKFTTASGYLAMACFAIGFSLIYQSGLPQEEKKA